MNQSTILDQKFKLTTLKKNLLKLKPNIATQLYKPLPQKYLLILFILCLAYYSSFCQTERYLMPAYTLSQIPGENVMLHQMNSNTKEWKILGNTGTTEIRSLAIDSKNKKIYAVDGGKLGTLNQTNGKFTAIGSIGVGVGDEGIISINSIYALTYDDKRNILYASHRKDRYDVILKINPKDGKIIKGGMVNEAGKSRDYKVIEIKTYYFAQIYPSYNFVDLAYDSETEILYIAHYYGIYYGINGILNVDKQTARDLYRRSPIEKLAGIAFNFDGQIFGSFSDNKISIKGKNLSDSSGPLEKFFDDVDNIDFDIDKKAVFYGLDIFKTSVLVKECAYEDNLYNPFILSSSIVALKTITSSSVIYRNMEFIAGESVLLNNNFEVRKSANFEILIEDSCD